MRPRPWAQVARQLVLWVLLSSCNGQTTVSGGDAAANPSAAPNELREPPVFGSVGGVLDLLVIAKAATIAQFAPYAATGFVYEICPRPGDGSAHCPPPASSTDAYGGARLQLSAGDVLKVHLVNLLPPMPAARGTPDPALEFLNLNPTNLHLHGMLVSPRYATAQDPTWGDNVFVYDFNSANGAPPIGSRLHGVVAYDAVDYQIPIPSSHPSGLYWFHPHIHGIAASQVAAGLSGILTVGQVDDYVCAGRSCESLGDSPMEIRHLILKDTQVLADGSVPPAFRSDFCGWAAPGAGDGAAPRQGGCAGVDEAAGGGANFSGGHWYFTINGQIYPTLTIGAPAGQLLRIVNASASTTYDLNLWNAAEKRQMLMQVISIDGVSIDVAAAGNAPMNAQAAGRFQSLPCAPGGDAPRNVCTRLLHMMPSTRAEVWVTYRDSNGAVMAPPPNADAVLRTDGFQAGPSGDTWPAVDLAYVRFVPGKSSSDQVTVDARTARLSPAAISAGLRSANADVPGDPTCTPLPQGHMRRIFFNAVPGEALGLGYEEVDEHDVPVPGSFADVAPFNPIAPTVCVPLAAGNMPVTERWELVNLSGSDHNFHLHQTHFSVSTPADLDATALPGRLGGRAVVMDSLPLRHADGVCATVSDWRNGACTAHVPTVDITFTVAGDFVYHCHILSHEDAGMMAVIRVRSNAASGAETMLNRVLSSTGLVSAGPRQPQGPPFRGGMCAVPRPRD